MISRKQAPLLFVALGLSMMIGFLGCDKSDDTKEEPQKIELSNPVPSDGASDQQVYVDLAWYGSESEGRPLNYDVYFGTSSDPQIVNTEQSDTTYDPGTLSTNETYYWRIVAYNDQGDTNRSSVWSFTTVSVESPPEGMVLVEATSFQMGTGNFGDYALPIHTVNVPAYYIDKYEVTNGQYRAFCTATGHAPPPDINFDGMPNYYSNPAWDNYPVGIDNWQDAKDYCAWRGEGYRLPSEAEWELAAKGSTDNRLYPWGDSWIGANANHWANPDDGYLTPSPVGSYPNGISAAGCYDMAGNVFEWCEDDWHENYYGAPTNGSAWVDQPRSEYRVRRGGSWDGSNTYGQCAYRTFGLLSGPRYASLGFRCVKTP